MKKQSKKKVARAYNKKKMRIISISLAIILIASAFITFYYIAKRAKVADSEYVKPPEPTFMKNGQLQFINKNSKAIQKSIAIEIADNDDKRAQGLMWRHSMPDSIGMLFIFEDERPLSFWMKNTYIPLDIIYINKSLEIVTIQENTTPLSEMPIPSDKPAQYVIEVIAGFCGKNVIEVGDKVKFEKINVH